MYRSRCWTRANAAIGRSDQSYRAVFIRVTMSLKIDLHCHSTVSDGVLSPGQVVARAHANGVQVLALTDHDETGGLGIASDCAQDAGIHFVPGVEVSVTWAGHTVHIVGLGIAADDATLNAGLEQVRSGRCERARTMA